MIDAIVSPPPSSLSVATTPTTPKLFNFDDIVNAENADAVNSDSVVVRLFMFDNSSLVFICPFCRVDGKLKEIKVFLVFLIRTRNCLGWRASNILIQFINRH